MQHSPMNNQGYPTSVLERMTPFPYNRVTSNPIGYYHTVLIDGDISDLSEYREIFNLMSSATEADVFHLKISTAGGSINTAAVFYNNIKETNAKVITEISGECCSAGTLIFLSGDEYKVAPIASFMAHSASYGAYGKAGEVERRVAFYKEDIRALFESIYTGFLTEEEIDRMILGDDFWLSREQIVERLDSYRDYRIEQGLELPTLTREYAENLSKDELVSLLFDGEMP